MCAGWVSSSRDACQMMVLRLGYRVAYDRCMSLILKQVFGLIRLLNSETGSRAIASGMALGLILALSPLFSLQGILVLLVILIFRVQVGAAFLSAFFFKGLTLILAPALDLLGQWVLELPALQGLWTTLYQAPLVPWTRFNHSVVMGGGVLGLGLVVPAYFVFVRLVANYRTQVRDRLVRTRFWKWCRATTVAQLYFKYEKAREVLS